MELPLALGKTLAGEVYLMDLAQAPHLLIAGAANQGLQTGLKTIITSLLYKKRPDELKLVLVDTEKFHFSNYAQIANHYLATISDCVNKPIICDADQVLKTLRALDELMEQRFDLLAQAQACNIQEYNNRVVNQQLSAIDGHSYMPYVVLIVNEIADLIMTYGLEMQMLLARIAQLSRAVGIHMVIATQRPHYNILTGIIKANLDGRIAFRVKEQADSLLILDQAGAEALETKGSMLVLDHEQMSPVQGAYTDMLEVERINAYIKHQPGSTCPLILPEPANEDGYRPHPTNQEDPLYDGIVDFVLEQQPCTCSMIQCKFCIGYNRARCAISQIKHKAEQGDKKAILAVKNLESKE